MGTIELNTGGITTGVTKFIKHPGYTQSSRLNDIGLLKLDTEVEFDQFIQPLTLPANDVEADSTLTLSGWGYLSVGKFKKKHASISYFQNYIPSRFRFSIQMAIHQITFKFSK